MGQRFDLIAPLPPSHLRHSRPADLVGWLGRQRRRFRIVGNSMEPLLLPGTEVLIDPGAYRHSPPQPGDVVVAYHPHQSGLRVIKWVVYVAPEGCFLQGVNTIASSDSREFGLVSCDRLLGRVICRFP